MRLVDAVVDDPDLEAGAVRGERRLGEPARVDRRRVGPGERPVGGAGVDAAHAGQASETGQLGARQRDRQAVRHDPVVPADARVGGRGGERLDEASLLRLDSRARRRRVVVRQRARRQLDDDLADRPCVSRGATAREGARERGCSQDGEGEKKTPHGY